MASLEGTGEAKIEKMTSMAYMAAIFSTLAFALDYMDWQFLANVAPLITKEFGLSSNQMAVLLGAPMLGAGLGGLFSGWLSDRLGRVKTMAMCLVWFTIFTVFFPSCTSFGQLFAFRILAGIGLGAQWGVGNTLVAEWLPAKHRMLGSALIQAGSSIGLIIGAYLTSIIVPVHGWRPLFYTSTVGFVFAVLALILLKESDAWKNAKARHASGDVHLGDIKLLLQPPYFKRSICSFFLVVFVLYGYWGASSWLPTWLATTKGLSVAKSMNYLYMVGFGAIFWYMVIGLNSWRWGRKAPAYVSLVLGVPAVLIFTSINDNTSLLYFTPVYSALTIGVSAMFGGFIAELFPTHIRGTAVTGVYNLARMLTFGAPFLLSAIAGKTSMTVAISCTAALYILALIPLKLLPETKGMNEL